MKKSIILVLVTIVLQLLLAWGHIAMWHNWTWMDWVPGSAWIATIVIACLIGGICRLFFGNASKGLRLFVSIISCLICGFAIFIGFYGSPLFFIEGTSDWMDWILIGLTTIIGMTGSVIVGYEGVEEFLKGL